jgi:hypothetical protein
MNNAWLGSPEGRRLEQPSIDPGYQGSVGPLRRADEASLRAARRHLREIPEKHIEGQGLQLTETTTGETWEVVTSFVDLVDPKQTGAEAFVVRDGWLVPLRPPGWRNPADESREAGEIYGRKADPKDPLPVPMPEVY